MCIIFDKKFKKRRGLGIELFLQSRCHITIGSLIIEYCPPDDSEYMVAMTQEADEILCRKKEYYHNSEELLWRVEYEGCFVANTRKI